MAKTKQHDYCPKPPEYDRYLFLEAILSARRYFLISYVETQTSCANKTSFPSLLVTELLSYLDGSYESEGKKISDVCVIKHPFYPFDSKYFSGKNYSQRLYQSALAYYHHKKREKHSIIGGWNIEEYEKKVEDQFIDIADLIRFAKNPLKTYFNKTLGVYLEREEKISDVEEFTLSPLEKYFIKQDLQHHALDDVFTFREKMGKMPPGIFQKVEKQKMDKIDFVMDDSIVVEFDPQIMEVTCIQENIWKVPSIEIEVNQTKVYIVGRMENITEAGLWIYGEGKPKDLYKHWPQCLLMNYIGNISQQQAIMAKNGKTVSIQFSECDEMVKNYIHLYWVCLHNVPLIIPEWTDDLQSNDLRSFKRKAQKHLSETYNEYLTFVFNEEGLEDMPDHYFNEWKKIAEQTYGSETKH